MLEIAELETLGGMTVDGPKNREGEDSHKDIFPQSLQLCNQFQFSLH